MPDAWIPRALLVGTFAFAGCFASGGDCVASQNPRGQAAVCNHTNSFSYSYQAASHSTSDSFPWENTLGQARVGIGSQLASGSMTLKIRDAAGTQVFTRSYSGTGQTGGTESTSAGTAGSWAIDFVFSGVTGQVAVTVTATR